MGTATKKIAAIYDPYLDTLGGGERYCLTIAETLIKNGYEVHLFWSGSKDLISQAQSRFSLDLGNIKIIPDIFNLTPYQSGNISLIQRYQITKCYDFFFFLSDGSIPFLFSKKNILHVQVPFLQKQSPKRSVFNFIKLLLIDKIACNSGFTQDFTRKYYRTSKTLVLYPPVDVDQFKPGKKQNIILSVGRFDNILNAKRQDILIKSFKKLFQSYQPPWKLILAGGSQSDPKTNTYLQNLQSSAKGYPIEFFVNPPFSSLRQLYSKSKIYWHAAGYGVDQSVHPEKTEHFGITIVEAMASGLVPLAVNKGGLPEIIDHGKNGFCWQSTSQLINNTHLLTTHPKLLSKISQNAVLSSARFSKKQFNDSLLTILKSN